ncbi:MAG: Fic family protein [Pirellulaceae bacterium]
MLPPQIAAELYTMYLAKGVRATTAIEGNTLTEEQVRERIQKVNSLPKSLEYQGREVDNLLLACGEIADKVTAGDDCDLTVDSVARYNSMVLSGLPVEEHVVPGEIRNYEVGVGRYRGAPPQDCRYLLERLCAFINDDFRPPDASQKIAFGVMRSIVAHLYLAWIHPFGDGNGRTARLLEFQLLLGAGVPAVSAHLLSNHYNETRPEYYRQLDAARRSPFLFMDYAVQGLVDRLDKQIKRIRRYQYAVMWKDFVYDKFREHKTRATHRQRLLALAIGTRKSKVQISELWTLTPALAQEYGGKTSKTVMRDVNALRDMGLVHRTDKTVSANRAKLQGFLPSRRDKDKWM